MFSRWGEGPDWPLWNDKTVSLFFKVNVECRKSESIDWSLAKPSKPNFCCDLTYLANPQQTVLDILDNTDGMETLWVLVALQCGYCGYTVSIVGTCGCWYPTDDEWQPSKLPDHTYSNTFINPPLSLVWHFLKWSCSDRYGSCFKKNLWIYVWGINSEEGLCNRLQKYPFRPPESKSCLFHVGIFIQINRSSKIWF